MLGRNAKKHLAPFLDELSRQESPRYYLDFVEHLDDLNQAFIAEAPGLSLVFRSFGTEAEIIEASAALRATSGYPPMLLYSEETDSAWKEYTALGAADFATFAEINVRKIDRWYHLAASRATAARISLQQDPLESNFDAKSHFYAVTESLAEGLTIFSRDGFLEYCNSRFAELTGYRREELKGKRIYEIFFPDGSPEQESFKAGMEKRLFARRRGISEIYETQIYRKNGERRWVESKAAPLRDIDGRIIGSIGASTDITERKSLEEQLRWSQKMEAVGRLAGGVAHDFNNLLTAIYGYAEMILKKLDESDPLYRKVNIIRRSSEAACAITRQLLTISRKTVVQKTILSLPEVVRDTREVLRGLIGEHIAIEVEDGDSSTTVESDAAQLQQIIINLAINARDAMEQGGTLRMSTQIRELPRGMVTPRSSLKPGRYVVLSVTDTGSGMSREVMSHLFEPFFSTKKGKGSGLGLSTVYAIVKQHKGEVLVESKPGKGSKFEVYLPAAEGAAAERVLVENCQHTLTGTEHVLVAEDEESVRGLVKDILEHQGYTVTLARDGAEAIDIALGSDIKIDLLLTDVIMPRMNGIELAKEVLLHRPQLKVLFMSGYTDDSTIPETISRLKSPFIAKPFSPESLAIVVRNTLDAPISESSESRMRRVHE